jgi:hypothetical protein
MLLHSTLLPVMMPSVMSEQTEPSERTANETVRYLSFAEAAERLNITADVARMRVHCGTLASVRVTSGRSCCGPNPNSRTNHEPNEQVR